MKNTWLFYGLVYVFATWIPSVWMFVIFMFCMLIHYLRHYSPHPLFFILLLPLFITWFPHDELPTLPKSQVLHVKEIKQNYLLADNGEQQVVVYGVKNIGFDDVIQVKGDYKKIDTIHNIRMFSFQDWLARKKIFYQIYVKDYQVLHTGTSLRHRLFERVQKLSDKRAKDWIKAMLFGIHENDISFFITSSGMHIAFLAHLLEKVLLKWFTKANASCIVLFFTALVGYCTLFSSTLIRILCFRIIAFLCPHYSSRDKVGISMCVILILFPFMAWELAFLLPIAFRLVMLFNVERRKTVFINFGIMIPMQFLFFHSCNPVQILLFRISRMAYAFIYVTTWLYLLVENRLLYESVAWFIRMLQMIEHIGITLNYTPSGIWLIVWTLYFINYISFASAKIIPLCTLLLYAPCSSYFDPFGEILMIDVGQGDCTLVQLPFHQGVLLIDVMGSHTKNIAKDIIVPILHAKGIRSIDQVIITHNDYDHSGGLKELQELIEVKKVIREKRKESVLGPLHIPFLLQDFVGQDANENSIITYLQVYGLRVLFMGDGGYDAEQALLKEFPKLEVDVLKVGHHGSKTSSSPEFIHQINPILALISAGRNNRYGHPHKETLNRFENENVLSLITSKNGAVSIKFCKYFAILRTAGNEFGIIDFR